MDPTKYEPGYDYSNFEESNPTVPKSGHQLDNDFANIAQSIDQIVDALKDVRRSDGKLKNAIVTRDSLTVDALLGFGAPSPWAADTLYTTSSTVFRESVFYKAKEKHTSGQTFDPTKWDVIADFGGSVNAAAASAASASSSAGSAATSAAGASNSASAASTSAAAAQAAETNAATARAAAEAAQAAAEAAKAAAEATVRRERLPSDRTYYVRTNGSDSNNGLTNTAAGAWATIQHAYDYIAANLDLAGHIATVQLDDGTYTAGLDIADSWTGGGGITFQGNAASPQNVLIQTTDASCFNCTVALPGILTVKDMELRTISSGNCLGFRNACNVWFSNLRFGPCGAYHIVANGPGANIQCHGNYLMLGGGFGHVLAVGGGRIQISGFTITHAAVPNFTQAYAQASRCGVVEISSNTYAGTATGSRYNVDANGVVYSGATLPGDAGGTTSSGGQYL